MLRWCQALGAHSRQNAKKGVVGASDIILVGLRDYQDSKCDVILKYNADEARQLKAYGEIPDTAKLDADQGGDDGDGGEEDFAFDFEEI